LAEVDPGVAALALWCRHRDGDGEDVAWTEGDCVVYGKAFEGLADHEQVGVAAHHVLHIALRHGPRGAALRVRLGPDYDPEVFNLAADAILNTTLLLAGFGLPRPCPVLPELLRAALDEERPAREALVIYDAETLYVRLAARGRRDGRAPVGRPEGGASEAQVAPHERAQAYGERVNFRRDLGERSGRVNDEDMAAAEWRERVARALAESRAAGRGIGASSGPLADLPRPRVRWETVLRGLVSRALLPRAQSTPLRPSRRWIAVECDAREHGRPVPAFEPGRGRSPAPPRLAICLDCSASIDDTCLGRFGAELAGIGRRTGAEGHVFVFDAEVRTYQVLRSAWDAEIRALRVARGGGTDFRPVLAAAAKVRPDAIIVLTDLDGPTGAATIKPPVIWAVPGPDVPEPPFGWIVSLGG
jgi:predicted metal-dependent peptidase